jgi:hypothetical protein
MNVGLALILFSVVMLACALLYIRHRHQNMPLRATIFFYDVQHGFITYADKKQFEEAEGGTALDKMEFDQRYWNETHPKHK